MFSHRKAGQLMAGGGQKERFQGARNTLVIWVLGAKV